VVEQGDGVLHRQRVDEPADDRRRPSLGSGGVGDEQRHQAPRWTPTVQRLEQLRDPMAGLPSLPLIKLGPGRA
jgi:hypothetical protein